MIQWYPGHMHKAGKEIKEILPTIDVIIEVIDARIPFSSQNPMLAALRGDKPCIKVLSKSDLADPDITLQWQSYLEQEHNTKTLAISIEQPEKIRQLVTLCHKMCPIATTGKHLQVLIMGIPNVGKSTLINTLANRIIAKTANEPAVTKRQQRIDIGERIILLDTPGMLWPNIENRHSGYRLAITGAIKDTAIDHQDITSFAADYLVQHYLEALTTRFQLKTVPENGADLLLAIGKHRGCLQAGGHVNLDKAAKILLTELRSGQLGQISWETPGMMTEELIEVAVIREQKAEKKRLRKQKVLGHN